MTEAIYLEVSEKTEAAQKAGRRFSVSGMLKFLGVSRSGYRAWLHRVPSDTEKRRESVKAKIQDIYDDSKQNYGAPKITVELRKTGEVISERTVGRCIRRRSHRAPICLWSAFCERRCQGDLERSSCGSARVGRRISSMGGRRLVLH